MRWIENWLDGRAQRVVISSTESHWRLEAPGVPPGSVNSPICGLGEGTDVPSARLLVLQGREERLTAQEAALPVGQTWAGWRVGQRNLMKFHKGK